ncbi:MAG TPA: M90 family metallopeptidase [Gemmatimonadales bacterium]|jgi:hypothetical protein
MNFKHFGDAGMPFVVALVMTGAVLGVTALVRRLFQRLPRSAGEVRLPTGPVPAAWPGIIRENVRLARALEGARWTRLLRLVQNLLRDTPMEGCGGLELTEAMRVTIAATACLLLVDLSYPRFARLRRVLVYPDTFMPLRIETRGMIITREQPPAELGEAWRDGVVVLAWNSVKRGDAAGADGHNVVLHEFAHVLDGEDGVFDGAPVLDTAAQEAEWERIMASAYADLLAAIDAGTDTVLDPYAATNRSEFFAVATETFFETPQPMQQSMPDVYRQLRAFYGQDPEAHRL